MSSTATLYIVRHGNTFDPGEVVTRVGGRTDLPLSSSGRLQVEALGQHFAAQGLHFETARSGPLLRTRQTAEAVLRAQRAKVDIEIDPFLREIDYGPDENKPEGEVLARIGSAALEAWERHGTPPAGWRGDPQAITANWRILFGRLAERPGRHLVATSNGIARFALFAAGAAGFEPKLRTAAYGVIELEPEGPHILAWNVRP